MACSAPWMLQIIDQIEPPLNVCGDCVINCQISDSLSFHTSNAFSRFCTTQLSDIRYTSLRGGLYDRPFCGNRISQQ